MTILLSEQDTVGTALQQIRDQLLVDYPKSALGWVADVDWQKPSEVPLDEIDYTDPIFTRVRDKEDTKVARFAKKISAGWKKPVILIRRPSGKLKAIDGHTRLTAYRKLNKPAYAWVGTVKTQQGPWDGFHEKQLSTLWQQVIELEHVRTEAGAEFFHEPIGSLIVRHSHGELLAMRKDMQSKYPRSDPRVKHIRKAVEASREAGHNAPNYVAEKRLDEAPETAEGMRGTFKPARGTPKGTRLDSPVSKKQPFLSAEDKSSGKPLAKIDEDTHEQIRSYSMSGAKNPEQRTAFFLGIPESEARLRSSRHTSRETQRFYKNDPGALEEGQKQQLRDVGEDPDAASLAKQIADMQAKEKARIEAENKARFPGGSLTINDQVDPRGKPSSVPGKSMDDRSKVAPLEGDTAWATDNGSYTTTVARANVIHTFLTDGDYFDDLQASLRGGAGHDETPDEVQGEGATYLKAISDSKPFTSSVLVHRGIYDPEDVTLGDVGSKVGSTFVDKGVVATTPDVDTAKRYESDPELGTDGLDAPGAATIHITLPIGTKALKSDLNVSNSSRTTAKVGWREYTLPPGSCFRIESDRVINGKRVVNMTHIPKGTP